MFHVKHPAALGAGAAHQEEVRAGSSLRFALRTLRPAPSSPAPARDPRTQRASAQYAPIHLRKHSPASFRVARLEPISRIPLQLFRLRGKQLPRTGLFTGRFASTSGRSDRASRGAEAKPLVANDVLCHEVEKLARAALFPASAAFAPVRSGQNYLGRRRSPSPPAGGKGARHDRGLHVKWGVGTFVRMVYCQRRKEEACGGSP